MGIERIGYLRDGFTPIYERKDLEVKKEEPAIKSDSELARGKRAVMEHSVRKEASGNFDVFV